MATPTAVSVTNLGDYWPTFNATRTVDGVKVFTMQWEISTSSIFASTLFVIEELTLGASAAVVSKTFEDVSRLNVIPAGTYYVRARQLENGTTPGAWSTTYTMTSTVAAPSVSTSNLTSPAGSVGSNTPNLTVDAVGDQSMSNYKRKLIPIIQLAAAADFSGTTYTNDVGSTLQWAASPTRLYWNGVAGSIPSGTYYVRMRFRDEVGAYSSWIAGANATITVSATASSLSPGGGSVIPYALTTQLSWTYNDLVVGSAQTAYQVIVYRSDTSAVVLDTGKVVSAANSATVAISDALKEVALYWTVKVWNTQDYGGATSSSALFTLTEPAALTFTQPVGSTVNTGRPTFSWSVGGLYPLKSWTLAVRRQSDNVLIWSKSGGVGGYPVTPPNNILVDDITYVATLTVTNTANGITTATKTFTADYTPPDSPLYTVSNTSYVTFGYVTISWASATPATAFYSWQVYRREQGESTWNLIFNTTDKTIRSYQDWMVSNGVTYEYTVSQIALVVDSYQESALVSLGSYAVPDVGAYWLIDPDDNVNNVMIGVVSDSFNYTMEEALIPVLGRGNVKEYGTDFGFQGDLELTIRNSSYGSPRYVFEKIMFLRDMRKTLTLRDPFGNISDVGLGSISMSHLAGTGANEMFNMSIHVDEVF